MEMNPEDNLLELGEELKDTPVPMDVAIGSIALNFALKYHDINTVQDGALYQQYKLEGKNLKGLHIQDVFDTAILIEHHLMSSKNRLSEMVVGAFVKALPEFLSDMDDESGSREDFSE